MKYFNCILISNSDFPKWNSLALFFSKMVENYVKWFSTFLTAINYSSMEKKNEATKKNPRSTTLQH